MSAVHVGEAYATNRSKRLIANLLRLLDPIRIMILGKLGGTANQPMDEVTRESIDKQGGLQRVTGLSRFRARLCVRCERAEICPWSSPRCQPHDGCLHLVYFSEGQSSDREVPSECPEAEYEVGDFTLRTGSGRSGLVLETGHTLSKVVSHPASERIGLLQFRRELLT